MTAATTVIMPSMLASNEPRDDILRFAQAPTLRAGKRIPRPFSSVLLPTLGF
jgi:hypothetical protein